MEIFKNIIDYEGSYQVSDLATVKSLKRKGCLKDRILNPGINSRGYNTVALCKNGKQKSFNVAVLVAMAFLDHKPDGTNKIVVDHDNNIKTDDRVENLKLITNRENSSKDQFRHSRTSEFVGVSWHKPLKKWVSIIQINNKQKHLGYFDSEIEASNAYQNKLKKVNQDLQG